MRLSIKIINMKVILMVLRIGGRFFEVFIELLINLEYLYLFLNDLIINFVVVKILIKIYSVV